MKHFDNTTTIAAPLLSAAAIEIENHINVLTPDNFYNQDNNNPGDDIFM